MLLLGLWTIVRVVATPIRASQSNPSQNSLFLLLLPQWPGTVLKMPKIDTLDALEEHAEHEDDYQTNSNS